MATGNADESRLASALACVPQSDLAIRLEAPQETRVALTGIGIAVAGTAIVVSSLLPADRTITFAVGFAMVPVLALLRIRCSAIRGFGGVSWAIVPDRMVREGLLIGLICVASFGYGVAVGAPHVMTAMAIATAIGLACTVPALRHHAPEALAGEPSVTYESEAWRNVLLPLLIIGATEVLMNRTGVILLGWLGDTKGAGVYSLAFNIAMVVTLPKVALNTLFGKVVERSAGPLRLYLPEFGTVSWPTVVLSLLAVLLIFVLHRGIVTTLFICGALAVGWHHLAG